MTPDTLTHWIKHPETLDKEAMLELGQVLRAYPCFSAVRMLYLKALYQLGDLNYHSELFKTSLSVPDRRVLYGFINDLPYPMEVVPEGQPEADAPVAEAQDFGLIDTYLEGVVGSSPTGVTLESGYVGYSLEMEHGDGSDVPVTDPVIGDFLAHPSEQIVRPAAQSNASAEADAPGAEAAVPAESEALPGEEEMACWEVLPEYAFTETLARIYIKQKKYERAVEIFKSLMLKNPEKSIYFADRIRFLEKVINHLKK